MFRSLANVVPSHLLDARLFDFAGLAASGTPDPEGDVAFDPQALPPTTARVIDFMDQDAL
jgi:tRNA 2-thiocytidine biosynthesis protein TtcA